MVLNRWNHVVLIYNGRTVQAYINGQPQTLTQWGSGSASLQLSSDTTYYVANNAAGTRGMAGGFSELQMWDTALARTDVEQLFQAGR